MIAILQSLLRNTQLSEEKITERVEAKWKYRMLKEEVEFKRQMQTLQHQNASLRKELMKLEENERAVQVLLAAQDGTEEEKPLLLQNDVILPLVSEYLDTSSFNRLIQTSKEVLFRAQRREITTILKMELATNEEKGLFFLKYKEKYLDYETFVNLYYSPWIRIHLQKLEYRTVPGGVRALLDLLKAAHVESIDAAVFHHATRIDELLRRYRIKELTMVDARSTSFLGLHNMIHLRKVDLTFGIYRDDFSTGPTRVARFLHNPYATSIKINGYIFPISFALEFIEEWYGIRRCVDHIQMVVERKKDHRLLPREIEKLPRSEFISDVTEFNRAEVLELVSSQVPIVLEGALNSFVVVRPDQMMMKISYRRHEEKDSFAHFEMQILA